MSKPPHELVDAWVSQKWGLPYSGGWKQQPVGMFEKMTTALHVYESVKRWRASKNWAKWARENPDAYEIVKFVMKLRLQNGN